MPRVRVCSPADVPSGEARRFAADGIEVAVVNLGDDGFRALEAICSHEHAYLDEGEVDTEMCTLECPKHGSVFDLDSGKPLALPAIRPVRVFALTVEDDDILIEV